MDGLEQSAEIMTVPPLVFQRPLISQACLIWEAVSLVKDLASKGKFNINVRSVSVLQCDCEEVGRQKTSAQVFSIPF